MADVFRKVQRDFWSPPSVLDPLAKVVAPVAAYREMAAACAGCGSEFMIAAKFCHTCGLRRELMPAPTVERSREVEVIAGMWARAAAGARDALNWAAETWRAIPFPVWLRYLHFHEIKRLVGLPTAALIAFIVGLGCVAGAVGVSLFFKASNLAEFQPIQMWRIEWLLGATASFVAGILLKKPSGDD